MQEKENEGISLLEICNILWKKKILMAIVVGITLIIIVLTVFFWYNPQNITYTSDFELSFNGLENNSLPNGKHFNYKNMVSKENLLIVKNSKEKYKNINIDKLYKSDSFKITRDDKTKFTITISNSKINNKELIAEFVEDLVANTIQLVENNSRTIYYMDEIKNFYNYGVYIDAINYLLEYVTTIINDYNQLISTYGEFYIIGGKTLKSYQNEVNLIVENSLINSYLNVSKTYLYVKDEAAKASFKNYANNKIESLKRELEYLDNMIAVYAKNPTYNDEEIEQFTRKKTNVEIEINSLCTPVKENDYSEYTIKDVVLAPEEFKQGLDNVYKEIETLVKVLEENSINLNLESILLSYESKSIVSSTGGLSVFITIVVGLILGVAVGTAIALILEFSKKNFEEDKENKTV